jgi:hypothetical protein
MAYLDEHKAKFDNLAVALHLENRTQLKREANGGNSILFTYPPKEEHLYLSKASELFDENTYEIINISDLFIAYIEEDGISEFVNLYKDLRPSSHKLFMDHQDTHQLDLFDIVIGKIMAASKNKKIPVLIRTGVFYGTGIENINITDHKDIMALEHPLVIFYPGQVDGDNFSFLNAKQASKYRCTIIE